MELEKDRDDENKHYKEKKSNNISTNTSLLWSAILGIAGILVSLYLVHEHYKDEEESGPSICEISSRVSCSVVLKSQFAALFSIPLAVLGITWNAVHLALTFQIFISETKDLTTWIGAHFIWSLMGIGFVFYLLFAEIILGTLCPFCTLIHIITVGLFYFSWKIYSKRTIRPNFQHSIFTLHRWLLVIGIIHILLLVYFNYPTDPPLPQEKVADFAKCLTNDGIIMYGSPRCSHCVRQKKLFGEAFEFIKFINCDEFPCSEKNVSGYPTWIKYQGESEIERTVGVSSVEQLETWSKSCKIFPSINNAQIL